MENSIEPVSETMADTTRVCEIRFDCVVTMHDVGYRTRGLSNIDEQSKTPQWFRAQYKMSLENIKYLDPYSIGMNIKKMYSELEKNINQYEGQ